MLAGKDTFINSVLDKSNFDNIISKIGIQHLASNS